MSGYPFRQIHLDFHTSEHIPGIGRDFNPEQFAKTLKDAKVEAVNLFAKCHHGYFYYPTSVGKMHPHLDFDLLGEQIKACKSAGIRANIYLSVGIDEYESARHPDWRVRTIEGYNTMGEISGKGMAAGNPLLDKSKTVAHGASSSFWKFLCINNPEYRALIKAELEEILHHYTPPGIWLDIFNQSHCACECCSAEMRRMGMDPDNDRDVYAHGRLVEAKFYHEILDMARSIVPGIDVYHNGFSQKIDLVDNESFSVKSKMTGNTVLDIESLPSFLWTYNHYTTAVQYMNRKYEDKPITMMSGKFHRIWGDFGTLKNKEAMEYECFRALCYGSRVCLGDQLHPSGRLDETVYRQIGEVFAEIEKKQPWCEGTLKMSEVGIFLSNKALQGVKISTEGALRIFTELGWQFDFIDYESELDRYRLVVLPDDVPLSEQAAERLRAYIKNGGKVLITGDSALDLTEFGISRKGPSEFTVRYAAIDGFGGIPKMDWVTYLRGMDVEVTEPAKVLVSAREPYFERTPEHFCSHFQTPPSVKEANVPLIVESGNLIYISWPLFTDYEMHGVRVYRLIVKECLRRLCPDRMVECDLPTTAAVTLRKKERSLILHVLNYIIQNKCKDMELIEERFPLYNTRFSIECEAAPQKVQLVPQERPLEFSYNDGRVSFTIPYIDGHQMVEISM